MEVFRKFIDPVPRKRPLTHFVNVYWPLCLMTQLKQSQQQECDYCWIIDHANNHEILDNGNDDEGGDHVGQRAEAKYLATVYREVGSTQNRIS